MGEQMSSVKNVLDQIKCKVQDLVSKCKKEEAPSEESKPDSSQQENKPS
jgi:hypothetical protein